MRSACLHRLWLPFLLAGLGACAIVPMVLGQLPIIVDRVPTDAAPLPIIVDRPSEDAAPGPLIVNHAPTVAAQVLILSNGTPPTLGPPIETSALVVSPQPKPAQPPQSLPVPRQPAPPPPLPIAARPAPVPPLLVAAPPPLPVGPQRLPDRLAPVFEIEVLPPDGPVEAAPAPRGPTPASEDDDLDELAPAKFGDVIGIGPEPAPLWVGPQPVPQERPEEPVPVVEPASSFRGPIAEIAPADEVVPLSTLPVWPRTGAANPVNVAYPYQRPAPQPALAPQRPPLRIRVYEVISWPWRTLTEPFRD